MKPRSAGSSATPSWFDRLTMKASEPPCLVPFDELIAPGSQKKLAASMPDRRSAGGSAMGARGGRSRTASDMARM
jgi:hypothetical protein